MCGCVSGAAGAADRLREAVFLKEQQCELPGALQHPTTGQQPDQVRGQLAHPEGSTRVLHIILLPERLLRLFIGNIFQYCK